MKEVNKAPVTVLVIDDESEVLARLAAVLQEAGYHCHGATDAASAGETLGRITPDVIICDINLVGHSGLTTCEQLKRQAGIDVPMMFLSAAQVPDIIRRSHDKGGIYYLRKPFEASLLLQIIEKVLLESPLRTVGPAPAVAARPLPEMPKPVAPRIISSRVGSMAAK